MTPVMALVIFIVTGIGGVVSFGAFDLAHKLSPMLEAEDMLPMPPPYPPVPRFIYTKPEVLESLRR